MTRDILLDILAAATEGARESCGTLSRAWDKLGEKGLIDPNGPPEMQDIARRLYVNAKAMFGVCREIEEYMDKKEAMS